jgi:hypothetical protein
MTGLVRVTVTVEGAGTELVLAALVPLAEVVPDLARGAGLLDAATAPRGYRVLTECGRPLVADLSLAAQRVVDGDVLVVRQGLVDEPPSRYDDVLRAPAARRPWRWRRRGAGWPAAARDTPSARVARRP